MWTSSSGHSERKASWWNEGTADAFAISDDVGTSAGGQGTRDIVTEAIASGVIPSNRRPSTTADMA